LLLVWGTAFIGSGLGWCASRGSFMQLSFGVSLSVLSFVLAEAARDTLHQKGHSILAMIAHPVLVSGLAVALVWRALEIDFGDYLRRTSLGITPGSTLSFFLRPAVIALALTLDTERQLLRARAGTLLATTATSACFSLVGTALLVRQTGLSLEYGRALVSRSVTTPVALSMAEILGAHGGGTAVIVILTGVLGALLSPLLCRRFGFVSPFVVGVATGASSHGIGTASLAEKNPSAAAFSGITFAMVAVFSVALVSWPWLRQLVLALL
jgi:putative effector of murein hydrolase